MQIIHKYPLLQYFFDCLKNILKTSTKQDKLTLEAQLEALNIKRYFKYLGYINNKKIYIYMKSQKNLNIHYY